jgi:ferritin-like metal-binding protein YciE
VSIASAEELSIVPMLRRLEDFSPAAQLVVCRPRQPGALETMNLTTLHALYIEELRALYSAEHQLLHTLPRMGKAAAAAELREAFTELLHQTQVHVDRLDRMFVRLGSGPKGGHCYGLEGVIAEGKDLLGEAADSTVKDAALVLEGRRLVGYMMVRFACAGMLARRLGHERGAALLQDMLSENEARDAHLVDLARTVIPAVVAVEGHAR